MTYDEKGRTGKQQAQNGNGNWTFDFDFLLFVGRRILNDGDPEALILSDSRDSTLQLK
jgi:hypothetical protein